MLTRSWQILTLLLPRDRTFNNNTLVQYKGALVGLRAWAYLTLVRLYNKAAYYEYNYTQITGSYSPNILDKQEIIDKLIEEVEPYVLAITTGQEFEELRIKHYMNTKALLGELYLEKGDYSQAAQYLKLACESYLNGSSMLKVDRSYRYEAWATIFLNAESQDVENISVIPFSRAEHQYNPVPNWVGRDFLYMVKPTTILVDSFMAQITAIGAPRVICIVGRV